MDGTPQWYFLSALIPGILVLVGPLLRTTLGYGIGYLFFAGMVPLLDNLVGDLRMNKHHIPNKTIKAAARDRFLLGFELFPGYLRAVCAFNTAILALAVLFVVTSPALSPKTTAQFVVYVLSTASMCVVTSVCAHEFFHGIDRRTPGDPLLGDLLLWCLLNPVYALEHRNHHRFVGTMEDSSTARRGENLYSFACRRETASWRNAFCQSVKSYRDSKQLPVLFRRDRFVSGVLCCALFMSVVGLAGGYAAVKFYVAVGFMTSFLVSSGDYIQHYGIVRTVDTSTGKLEKVANKHSWDCCHLFSNVLLIAVGAHSYHHVDTSKPFTELPSGNSPCFPCGLIAMSTLALIPPAYFAVADRIIDSLESKEDPSEDAGS